MIRRWGIALGLGMGLAVMLLVCLQGPGTVALADPGLAYVAPGGNCGGASPCYATIQAAVDAALPGDEVRVAAGTYTGQQTRYMIQWSKHHTFTQVVFVTKTLTLKGGYAPGSWVSPDPVANPTIIDAERQGRGRGGVRQSV